MREGFRAMRFRSLPVSIAAVLLSTVLVSAEKPKSLVVWPGYVFDVPPNHCIETRNGPDFHVLYVRDQQSSTHVILAGIYLGFAPSFKPDCAKPVAKSWRANSLSFKSVRGDGQCAEVLVEDPAKTERGYLHLWFGPGAKEHAPMAESLIASIRPAPMPLKDVPDPPACK